jgi:hypothetical protein
VFVAAGIGVGGTFVFVAVGMGVNGAGVDVDRFNVGAGVESIAVGPVSVVPQPLSIHAARTNPILHIDNSLFISWLLSFQFIVLSPLKKLTNLKNDERHRICKAMPVENA